MVLLGNALASGTGAMVLFAHQVDIIVPLAA
jgi:hypothetical protein